MHLKHGRYWYVHQNKWTALDKDYTKALVEYAALIKPVSNACKVPELLDRYLIEAKPTLSKHSFTAYEIAARKLKGIFQEFTPDKVKPLHVAQMLDHYRAKPSSANIMRAVLKNAFTKAILWGLCETNPVTFVQRHKTAARDRYLTDAEFMAIRDKASPTLKAIMDICYLTGQRIGDVLAVRYADIEPDGIYFRQQKTGNRLKVSMTEELRAAITSARQLHKSVRGMVLFHRRNGEPLVYMSVQRQWNTASRAAGVEDAHIHDIRAKAATDAKAQGLDSKKLLGHAQDSTHARYLRSKEIPIAQPVSLLRLKKVLDTQPEILDKTALKPTVYADDI
jgi:integrase